MAAADDLLGPLANLASDEQSRRPTRTTNTIEAAFRQVDTALDHLATRSGSYPLRERNPRYGPPEGI